MTTEEYKEKYNITVDGFNVDYIGTQPYSGSCSAYQHASMLNMYYDTDKYDWKDYWNGTTADFDTNLTSVENFYSDESNYLDEIRKYLDEGIVVGLVVNNNGITHFVNAIGYELDENGEFTFGGIVVGDSASSDQKVHTIDESDYKLYEYDDDYAKRHGYRVIKPYLVDEDKKFILDENKEKTTDPYYIDPYKGFNGNTLSYEEGYKREQQMKQSVINSLIDCDISDYKKEIIARQWIERNCKDGISDEEYERLKKACEDKRIVVGATVTTTVTYAKANVTTARTTKYDPLIFDLDGDGYNVETKELGANFDLDKNGFAEKINWTSRDGFLCLDLNGNGAIDDGGELCSIIFFCKSAAS